MENTMKHTLSMYNQDLEVCRNENAGFVRYYHLIFDAKKDLNDKEFASFLYEVLNEVRALGSQEGRNSLKESMFKKISEL